MATSGKVVKLAAVSDVHYAKNSQGALLPLFQQISESADILLLCGDLTDYGTVEEARLLAKDLTVAVKIPIVGVLGNHDLESGQEHDLTAIFTDAGVRMLDGDAVEIHGVGFAGVRGFCGGFGRGALGAWGEKVIKDFVHEAINESLKLESALQRLRTEHRIAVLHYAPVRDTVEGEPPEIFPFLGSSRLEEPLTRFEVTAVFHGHAHRGAPEGKTSNGIPVYNVALPVLKACYPDRPPFRLFDIHRAGEGEDGVTPINEHRGWAGRRASDRTSAAAAGGENPSPS